MPNPHLNLDLTRKGSSMKKLLVAAIVAGLLVPPVSASAGKTTKPVKTTLYMHGDHQVGDGLQLVTFLEEGKPMSMDATEPAAGPPKSMSHWFSANEECAGNSLWPAWEGHLSGTVVGDLKVVIHTLGAPSKLKVRLWADIPFSSCSSTTAGVADFKPPQLAQEVDVPAGLNETTAVFKKVRLPIGFNLIAQVHTTALRQQGRVVYDAADFATRIEFNCIPAQGKTCA